MDARLVVCLVGCGLVGLAVAAAALMAGWGWIAAALVCSVTASTCLVPASLLAAFLGEPLSARRVRARSG